MQKALTISAPNGKTRVAVANADNKDIIKELEAQLPEAHNQVKKFRKNFEADTLEDTAKNVWKFLRKEINYKEDGENQDIRVPARFVSDATGDCKSYALLAAAIMSYYSEVAFRYSSFDPTDNTPSHVYCIVKHPYGGAPIIIDGVWKYFDSEKNPTSTIDHWMKVRVLSGIGDTTSMSPAQRQAKAQQLANEIACWIMERNKYYPGSAEERYCTTTIKTMNGHLAGISGLPTSQDATQPVQPYFFDNRSVVLSKPDNSPYILWNQANGANYYRFTSLADFQNRVGIPFDTFRANQGYYNVALTDLQNYKYPGQSTPAIANTTVPVDVIQQALNSFSQQSANDTQRSKTVLQQVVKAVPTAAKAALDVVTFNVPALALDAVSAASLYKAPAAKQLVAPVQPPPTQQQGPTQSTTTTTDGNNTNGVIVMPAGKMGNSEKWALGLGAAALLGYFLYESENN